MDRLSESLRCSFCDKQQGKVAKLISSANDYPRAYICDECVAVCTAIIQSDRAERWPAVEESSESHPLLAHPSASALLRAVENWIRAESLGADGGLEIAAMRDVASKMLAEKPIP